MRITSDIKQRVGSFLVLWFSGAFRNDLEALAAALEAIASEARRQAVDNAAKNQVL